jgi:phospholipid-transporting ATPase
MGDSSKRVLWVNGFEANSVYGFPSNYISTTKYNALSFFPKSLFEQFKRIANIYFLITAILQCIPAISPLNPFSAIAPLVIVISISMIREGVEDYLRYKADQATNSTPTHVYSSGKFAQVPFKDVQVGHIVLVNKDETFPCDLILLSSAYENGIAYIETANLDGEKNLKQRQAFTPTQGKFTNENIIRMHSRVECEPPNPRIYAFSGVIDYRGKSYSLDKKNILLSGAQLRNTPWAIGFSVYTGNDTKLRQNMMERRFKQSRVEKKVNLYIMFILAWQFCMCFVLAILGGNWTAKYHDDHYYLDESEYEAPLRGFLNFFTYFLLLNTMLPISLIVSLELIKLCQAFFMNNDLEMYSELRDRQCKVSASSLNEELGMIQHIFSDKTGTLTMNKMEFKFCTVGYTRYGDNLALMSREYSRRPTYQTREVLFSFQGKLLQKHLIEGGPPVDDVEMYEGEDDMLKLNNHGEMIDQFLRCLSLCHECLMDKDDLGDVMYIGQSPDEIALVDCARHLGYKYIAVKDKDCRLEIWKDSQKVTEPYERLSIMEFNSDRKRNSVVVRHKETGKYFLYMKGADNVMLKRMNRENSKKLLNHIKQDLNTYAERGLRTLVVAMKPLSEEEYHAWNKKFEEANCAIDDREAKLDQVAEEIEKDVYLLGCTAVEDKLQEEVPSTIQDLLKAGVSVWMLTGDKLETASNIGKTCSLLDENMAVMECPSATLENALRNMIRVVDEFERRKHEKKCALVIEGDVLEYILYDHNSPEKRLKSPDITQHPDKLQAATELREHFLTVAKMCNTVICCRVSPGQKREVVKLMKEQGNIITLAIGDGANDVPMILEADVGVGLYGEEGMQSVQASDYAIGEFRFLWDLVLLHGRFNYLRQSEMIIYFFYKNIVFTIPQFFFGFYCAYSGQTVYDDWYITFYNMVFTSLPLMIRALFEKDIDVPTRRKLKEVIPPADILSPNNDEEGIRPIPNTPYHKVRSEHPSNYDMGRENKVFTVKNFGLNLFTGLIHSTIIFFIPLYTAQNGILKSNGRNQDFWSVSITSFTCIILIVDLKLAVSTRLWNKIHFFTITCLSLVLYFAFIFFYDQYSPLPSRFTLQELASSAYFYLNIIVTVSLVLSLDIAAGFFRRAFWPTKAEKLQNYLKREVSKKKVNVENSE